MGPKFNNSINNDKLLNKEIEFIVLQLTHAERDLGWTSNDEKINTLGEFFCSDNWSFGSIDNITTNVDRTIPTNSFNWDQVRQSRHQEQKVQDHRRSVWIRHLRTYGPTDQARH